MRSFPVASVLFCLSVFPLSAKAISVSELPASIQSCVATGACSVNLSSAYEFDRVSAFQISGRDPGGWLMRYELAQPSGVTRGYFDYDVDSTTQITTAFNGYLWMRVQSVYRADEAAHPVTLFLDKVAPVPGSFYGQSGDLSLFMTTADLLAGGAYRQLYDTYDTYTYDPYGFDRGSLSGELPPVMDSGFSARLNLLQLNYQSDGSSIVMTYFAPWDARGLVYSQGVYGADSSYSSTQAFYVSAVPEPGVSWLFGCGLMAVVAARIARVGRNNRRALRRMCVATQAPKTSSAVALAKDIHGEFSWLS